MGQHVNKIRRKEKERQGESYVFFNNTTMLETGLSNITTRYQTQHCTKWDLEAIKRMKNITITALA